MALKTKIPMEITTGKATDSSLEYLATWAANSAVALQKASTSTKANKRPSVKT